MKTTGRWLVLAFWVAALGGCASSVTVVHTVQPQYSIVPAKVIAVVGTLGNDPPDFDENYFLNTFIEQLRGIGSYEVLDERQQARKIYPGHGLTDPADLQAYLRQTHAEAVAQVIYPKGGCVVRTNRDEINADPDGENGSHTFEVSCEVALDLFNARTGTRIAHIDTVGEGNAGNLVAATGGAQTDSAHTMIYRFNPEQVSATLALGDLDAKAPFFAEGMAMIRKNDGVGARALWKAHLAELPESAGLLLNLGRVSSALDDHDAAIDYYERAAKIYKATARGKQASDHLDEGAGDEKTPKKTAEMLAADETVAAAKQAAIDKTDAEIVQAAMNRAAQIRQTAVVNKDAELSSFLIPAGTFAMGCTDGDSACDDDEKPAHTVTISRPFYLAFTLTTNYQYQKCVDAGACHGKADLTKKGHPVVNVTWNQAQEFCAWTGGRLPTEAEWEYAARGGVGQWRFPWGFEAHKDDANFLDNGGRNVEFKGLVPSDGGYKLLGLKKPLEETSQVGTFNANGYGLDDMAGNVLQWTADWAGHYTSGAVTAPTGPAAGTRRILRGGSWAVTGDNVRVSVRYADDPDDAGGTIGFRCARDAKP